MDWGFRLLCLLVVASMTVLFGVSTIVLITGFKNILENLIG